jgi:hypothetical protein
MMLLYIAVAGGGGDNPAIYTSTAAVSQALALQQGTRRRLGPPTSHAVRQVRTARRKAIIPIGHSIVLMPLPMESGPDTGANAITSERLMASRERGLATQNEMIDFTVPDPTGLYALAIFSSLLYGALLGKRAVDRWISWEERELSQRPNKDADHHIVFSQTTNELGYGSCIDWTSDITKFDV